MSTKTPADFIRSRLAEIKARCVDEYAVSFSHNYPEEARSLRIAANGVRFLALPTAKPEGQ